MAGKIKTVKIDTKEARAKLEARGQPYYVELLTGLHLGYRKGARRGVFVARRRLADGDKYEVMTLGPADDGAGGMTYDAARRKAHELGEIDPGQTSPRRAKSSPYTVGDAVTDYLAFLDAKRKSGAKSRALAKTSIIPQIGDIRLRDLDHATLDRWLTNLANSPRRVRGGRELPPPATDEERRKRRASANRAWGVLCGALNFAFDGPEKHIGTNVAWARVKPLAGAEAVDQDWLEDADEIRRFVAACDGSFRDLVVAALHSGCRYGELCRLVVKDFSARSDSLLVRISKSGKHRRISLTEEASDFFRSICAGRAPDEIMLQRVPGAAWKVGAQDRPMRAACTKAGVKLTFHGLRHTYASHAIQDGLSTLLVARALGHATTALVERCYGHLAPKGVRKTIRELRKPLCLDA